MFAFILLVGGLAQHENPPVQWRGEVSAAVDAHRTHGLRLTFSVGYLYYELKQGQEHVSGGVFGTDLALMFKEFPRAAAEARTFQALRGAGTAMLVLSMAAGGLAFFAQQQESIAGYWAASVSSLVLSLGGGGLFLISPMFLSRAIAFYNEGVVARAVQERGAGVMVGGRF